MLDISPLCMEGSLSLSSDCLLVDIGQDNEYLLSFGFGTVLDSQAVVWEVLGWGDPKSRQHTQTSPSKNCTGACVDRPFYEKASQVITRHKSCKWDLTVNRRTMPYQNSTAL